MTQSTEDTKLWDLDGNKQCRGHCRINYFTDDSSGGVCVKYEADNFSSALAFLEERWGSDFAYSTNFEFCDINLPKFVKVLEDNFAECMLKISFSRRPQFPVGSITSLVANLESCNLVLDNFELSPIEFKTFCEWQCDSRILRSLELTEKRFGCSLRFETFTLRQHEAANSEMTVYADILIGLGIWDIENEDELPLLRLIFSNLKLPYIDEVFSGHTQRSVTVKTNVSCLRTFQLYTQKLASVTGSLMITEEDIGVFNSNEPDSPTSSEEGIFMFIDPSQELRRTRSLAKAYRYSKLFLSKIHFEFLSLIGLSQNLNNLLGANCLEHVTKLVVSGSDEIPETIGSSGISAFWSILRNLADECRSLNTIEVRFLPHRDESLFPIGFFSSLYRLQSIEHWTFHYIGIKDAFNTTAKLERMSEIDPNSHYLGNFESLDKVPRAAES